MTRTEKKTRIRKLPPRLQLTETDSLTGSYPTVARGAVVDNRTGFYNIQYNDKTTTVVFPTASSVPEMSYTSSLAGIPYVPGQDLQPFRDSDQFAADATSANNPFWSSGSNIEGFKAPLWSKNKIEIDISCSEFTAITASDDTGYEVEYNFNTKKWQQTTLGYVVTNIIDATEPTKYNEAGFAFTPSYHSHVSTYDLEKRGKPVSNFGFPWWWPTNPNGATFHMSQVLNKPFLVEKIYVEISASYIKGAGPRGSLSSVPQIFDNAVAYNGDNLYGNVSLFLPEVSNSYVVNNFFVLNTRKFSKKDLNQIYSLNASSDFQRYEFKPTVTSNNYEGSDLVTWFEIASFNDNYGYVTQAQTTPDRFYRDVTIIDSSSKDAYFTTWSQLLKMSGALRIPNATNMDSPSAPTFFDYYGLTEYNLTMGWAGSRNGLFGISSTGRDFIPARQSTQGVFSSSLTSYTESPYLLLPTDQIAFRWQMPMPETGDSYIFDPGITVSSSSYLIFPQSKAKVILYGSYVTEDEADNTSLNQLLSSESIHEALE